MRRRAPEPVKAPAAPSDRLLNPVIEDWVAPSAVTSLAYAQTLATERWTAEINHFTATPGWYLVLNVDWHRAFLVGNLEPEFADREAFDAAAIMTRNS